MLCYIAINNKFRKTNKELNPDYIFQLNINSQQNVHGDYIKISGEKSTTGDELKALCTHNLSKYCGKYVNVINWALEI